MILETDRLYLREMISDDCENAYKLNLDPDVIRYTGDSAFESIAEARHFLDLYDSYCKYGFGRWAVIRKFDEAYLGWCGLKYTPHLDEYDIGFRLMKEYWNQGYATEAAKACVEIGFSKFDIDVILGRTMDENLPSQRVLEKIGLQYWRPFDFDGALGKVYRINSV